MFFLSKFSHFYICLAGVALFSVSVYVFSLLSFLIFISVWRALPCFLCLFMYFLFFFFSFLHVCLAGVDLFSVSVYVFSLLFSLVVKTCLV